jgi:hypothetical protein
MLEQFFRIRNWEKFQHYKKMNPPWIRLYQSLLRDRAYQKLSDTSRSHLVGLFIIASQSGNHIPADQVWLKHELCTKTAIDLKTLSASGWIQYESEDASKVLAETEMLARCKQDALPETDSSDNSEVQRQIQTAGAVLMGGTFHNVKLSDDESAKLKEKFGPAEADRRIDSLSEYMASKGKKYSSHYATILSWARKNGTNGNGAKPKLSEMYSEEELEASRQKQFGDKYKERK